METKKKKHSLFGTLNLFVSSVVLTTGAMATVLCILFAYNVQLEERENNLQAITATIGKLVARPLSVGDFVLVEHYLSREGLPHFIQNLSVHSASGQLIAGQDNSVPLDNCTHTISTTYDIAISGMTTIAKGGPSHGTLIARAAVCDIRDGAVKLSVGAFALGIFLFLLITIGSRLAIRSALKPLAVAVSVGTSKESLDETVVAAAPAEITPLLLRMKELYDDYVRIEAQAKIGEFAAQVAHDIRSPLAAFDTFLTDLDGLPSSKRNVIYSAVNRVRDIANQLLEINHQTMGNGLDTQPSSILMYDLVDTMVSEKRGQYRSRRDITIDALYHEGVYGLFSLGKSRDIKRALSNLIDNAVESMASAGTVQVILRRVNDFAEIKIVDNGNGIPSEFLPHLGTLGFTKGKTGGSGLGLAQAKNAVEAEGGRFSIESQVGFGTTVTIELPATPVPAWFTPSITIPAGATVVLLDDDEAIHDVWRNRLANFDPDMRLEAFTQIAEWNSWRTTRNDLNHLFFVVDFDLGRSHKNGLELIRANGLQNHAVLVTSQYVNPKVLESAQDMGLKIIPKPMLQLVPLAVNAKDNIDCILIDDDPLVRSVWETSADERGKNIQTYETAPQIDSLLRLGLDLQIFVDYRLGVNIRGDDVARGLLSRGFRNVTLLTGDANVKAPSDHSFKVVSNCKLPPWEYGAKHAGG